MDKNVRDEFLKRISFEVFPKEGWDIYEIKVRFNDKFVGWIEVDGFEIESWKYKDEKEEIEQILTTEKHILQRIKNGNILRKK